METYIIRVNGREYVVEVEKATGADGIGTDMNTAAAQAAALAPGQVQAVPAERTAPAAKGQAQQPAGEAVKTGTAGKVWKVTSKVGDSVKRGDTILILEAMKMEIPVVAPVDGKVGTIEVAEGDSVENGQTVATVI